MAKTKISEFSATPGNNTDIDGINIAEGCAPSGINDAIRELMAQLKDWQAGTSNDPYVVGSSGSLTLSYGTANGVPYLNGSKVLTSGSALTFNGTNLGIGTSSPNLSSSSTALTVNTGTAANYSAIELASGGTLNYHINANNSAVYHVAAGSRPWIVYTNSSERMRIDSSGNVGIGTSSPTNQLHVAGATTTQVRVQMSGQADMRIISDTGYGALSLESAMPLLFRTSSTERARIDSSGNLLVGTTTVVGTGKISLNFGASGDGIAIISSGTSDRSPLTFYNGNGFVGRVSTSGSSTAYLTSSDYRLKENIQPMAGALAKVTALKPVTYKWKIDGADGQGFIAHELQEVVPECVTGEKDAVDADGNPQYQGIDTSFLVATLTAAIQELKAINDAQAETITALTARVTALETN